MLLNLRLLQHFQSQRPAQLPQGFLDVAIDRGAVPRPPGLEQFANITVHLGGQLGSATPVQAEIVGCPGLVEHHRFCV